MAGLGIHQPRRDTPLNQNTSREITAHAVTAILGEVAFNPLPHDANMTSDQTYGRAHDTEIYVTHYVEAMLEFTIHRQRKMEISSKVGHCINTPPPSPGSTYC